MFFNFQEQSSFPYQFGNLQGLYTCHTCTEATNSGCKSIGCAVESNNRYLDNNGNQITPTEIPCNLELINGSGYIDSIGGGFTFNQADSFFKIKCLSRYSGISFSINSLNSTTICDHPPVAHTEYRYLASVLSGYPLMWDNLRFYFNNTHHLTLDLSYDTTDYPSGLPTDGCYYPPYSGYLNVVTPDINKAVPITLGPGDNLRYCSSISGDYLSIYSISDLKFSAPLNGSGNFNFGIGNNSNNASFLNYLVTDSDIYNGSINRSCNLCEKSCNLDCTSNPSGPDLPDTVTVTIAGDLTCFCSPCNYEANDTYILDRIDNSCQFTTSKYPCPGGSGSLITVSASRGKLSGATTTTGSGWIISTSVGGGFITGCEGNITVGGTTYSIGF